MNAIRTRIKLTRQAAVTALGTGLALLGFITPWAHILPGDSRLLPLDLYSSAGGVLLTAVLAAGFLGMAGWSIKEANPADEGGTGDGEGHERASMSRELTIYRTIALAASSAISFVTVLIVLLLAATFPGRPEVLAPAAKAGHLELLPYGPALVVMGLLVSLAGMFKWRYRGIKTSELNTVQKLAVGILFGVLALLVGLDFVSGIWTEFPMLAGLLGNSLILALTVVGYEQWRENTKFKRFERVLKAPRAQFRHDRESVLRCVLTLRTHASEGEGRDPKDEIASYVLGLRSESEIDEYRGPLRQALIRVQGSLSQWSSLIFDSHEDHYPLAEDHGELRASCDELVSSWDYLHSNHSVKNSDQRYPDECAKIAELTLDLCNHLEAEYEAEKASTQFSGASSSKA